MNGQIQYLTAREVEELVSFTANDIRGMAKEGRFPKPVIFDSKYLWLKNEVLDWIKGKVESKEVSWQ